MLIISCHADTVFENPSLSHKGDRYHGHLDNFVGVYGVMKAYFSGRITNDHTRIELTYGEETDNEGTKVGGKFRDLGKYFHGFIHGFHLESQSAGVEEDG